MQLNLKPIFYDEQVLFDFMGHKVKNVRVVQPGLLLLKSPCSQSVFPLKIFFDHQNDIFNPQVLFGHF